MRLVFTIRVVIMIMSSIDDPQIPDKSQTKKGFACICIAETSSTDLLLEKTKLSWSSNRVLLSLGGS